MTTKSSIGKKTAIGDVNEKISKLKKNVLLEKICADAKESQLSLFDIAPWSDNMRAIPNDFARSALFSVRNKRKKREAVEGQEIFHINKDVSIFYTGIELRAEDDELVWQQILEYSKHTPPGQFIRFSLYELCKDLDWSINGTYYKKAEDCLSRLQATALKIESPRLDHIISISMIKEFSILDRGTKNAKCHVEISENMIFLFAGEHYSKFIWGKYRKLTPIARRLFDYLASHKKPYPLKLETFRLMCASDSKQAAKWKQQAKEACCELSESGLVATTWVTGDSIYCERTLPEPKDSENKIY
jgi:hypothetical protein